MGRVRLELTTLGLKVRLNKLKPAVRERKMLQNGGFIVAIN